MEQCAPRLNETEALPFLWPTRLADGLELEVFYVNRPNMSPTIRPLVSTSETLWFPRVARSLGRQLRQTLNFQQPDTTPLISSNQLETPLQNRAGMGLTLSAWRAALQAGYRCYPLSPQSLATRLRAPLDDAQDSSPPGAKPHGLRAQCRLLRKRCIS